MGKNGFLVGALLLGIFTVFSSSQGMEGKPLEGKKIALVIAAENFRDEEFQAPRDLLSQAGANIIVASSNLTEANGMLGMKVKPEVLVKDLKAKNLDAVLFIGGTGASEYFGCHASHQLAREVLKQGGVVGAICIAPVTLARACLLKGKKATVYESEKRELIEAGAAFTAKSVEVDGKIVTANGPAAAGDFAQAVLKLLQKAQ